jgi:hypothetical protein
MNRNPFILLALCALSAWCSSAALADTINVDFGSTTGPSPTYSGTAVAPDAGTTWNGVDPAADVTPFTTYTSGALVDSNGNPTNVTTTVNNSWDYYGAADSVIAPDLMHDYVFSQAPGGTFSFSIDGLTPGGVYDLYLYSDTGAQVTDFNIGGNVKIVTNTPAQSAWTQGANYEVYSGLVAVGGTISVSATGHDQPVWDNYGVLNGFQLQSVPEPSLIAMVVSGAVGLLACARRKK